MIRRLDRYLTQLLKADVAELKQIRADRDALFAGLRSREEVLTDA